MRKLFVLLAVGLVAMAVSCETLNIGGPGPFKFGISSVVVAPDPVLSQAAQTATVNFTGVTGPFTFTFTFSGGVTPLVQTVVVQAPATTAVLNFTTDFFAVPDAAKDLTVTVTGLDGNNTPAGPVSDGFHVDPIPDQPPVIDSATFNAATCVATVTAHDPDGDAITIDLTTAPAGATGDAASKALGAGGTVDFAFTATDIFAGGGGNAGFTASSGAGPATSAESTVAINCAGITLEDDTLYAIPLAASVAVGAPVRIVIATGTAANPFQYLTGVRITADTASGMAYNLGSFNVGLPGGTSGATDGAWTMMNPGSFLLPPDNLIQSSDAGGGKTCIDLNLTPIGGSDVTGMKGALINFEVTFTTAGTYHLGFQDINVVSHTYYQDGNQTPDYFWGDITNTHAGAPDSVTVN